MKNKPKFYYIRNNTSYMPGASKFIIGRKGRRWYEASRDSVKRLRRALKTRPEIELDDWAWA